MFVPVLYVSGSQIGCRDPLGGETVRGVSRDDFRNQIMFLSIRNNIFYP